MTVFSIILGFLAGLFATLYISERGRRIEWALDAAHWRAMFRSSDQARAVLLAAIMDVTDDAREEIDNLHS